MTDVTTSGVAPSVGRAGLLSRVRSSTYPLVDWLAALASSLLLILAFPDFEIWLLAALALIPLLVVIGKRPRPLRSFFLGWLTGTVFFYGSCSWLTYSMIHYGGVPTGLAYLLLIPVPLVVGLFPGVFSYVVARAVRRWGIWALLTAAFVWPALEWARLGIAGQLWNALGYSFAFQPALIAPAKFGGVYAVSFLLVAINAAVAFLALSRTRNAALVAGSTFIVIVLITVFSRSLPGGFDVANSRAVVVALQPNVPMDPAKSTAEMQALTDSHIRTTETALDSISDFIGWRLVIWPESPMNFTYGTDPQLRELLVSFAIKHHIAILFNSQEQAPNDGIYNSALFINKHGELIAQYDKIRLMPFGEYVPLPRWIPGTNLITAIVGDFTPGTRFTLMPVGDARGGVFICVESAYPFIARNLTREGADVLINISNDGYLGPTAVRRQHLANAVFRAVENDRPVIRVTNTGISAYIREDGSIEDPTTSFQPAVRIWDVGYQVSGETLYTQYGDLFAGICALMTVGLFISTFRLRTKQS